MIVFRAQVLVQLPFCDFLVASGVRTVHVLIFRLHFNGARFEAFDVHLDPAFGRLQHGLSARFFLFVGNLFVAEFALLSFFFLLESFVVFVDSFLLLHTQTLVHVDNTHSLMLLLFNNGILLLNFLVRINLHLFIKRILDPFGLLSAANLNNLLHF